MTVRAQRDGSERFERRSRALVLVPVGLIVLITVVDVQSPTDIHLGPLLVIAPALAVSLAGPRTTAAIGALAVVAQIVIALLHGGLMTSNHLAQIASLLVLSVLIVLFAAVRERRSQQLERAQSVAEVAQRALLRPLPERLGPLRIASLYLAAEDETQIGGDLYTATRLEDGGRLLIGDVRGKGLAAVGEAALLLSAFRLVAREHPDQPALTEVLDRHVHRYLVDFCGSGDETGEHFITALLVDIPDDEPVLRLTNSGHPPPLLLRGGRVTQLEGESAPPLGVQALGLGSPVCRSVPFDEEDVLLLYTDGVIEARNEEGVFYPLTERVSHWAAGNPETLVTRLCKDLLAHAGGRLGDDAAFLAVRRTRAPKPRPEHGHGWSDA